MTYLRLSEAAAKLGVSSFTVRRWADQGRLAVIRLPSTGERRIPISAVEAMLGEMAADHGAEGGRR